MLFDEQFKPVPGPDGSGFEIVGASQEYKLHTFLNMPVVKSGYLYVWVSNETYNINVFFDNLTVVHRTGPLLQSDDYYPFGLEMKMLGSRAAGKQENKKKYKGKELQSGEFADGSGLEWTDFGARMYDLQIGRWHVIDPLAEMYHDISPYAFVKNNPINNIEIDGRYFDEKKSKRISHRIERRAERKAGRLDRRADRQERKGNNEAAGDLRGRAGELRNSARDMRDMRNDDDTEYRFRGLGSTDAKRLNIIGPTTLRTELTNDRFDEVVTMFTEKKMSSKLHEGRHGGQNARNEFNIGTVERYGVADEIAAYRAEYSWKATLSYQDAPEDAVIIARVMAKQPPNVASITNITQINAIMVNSIMEKGRTLYPPKDDAGVLRIALDVWNAN